MRLLGLAGPSPDDKLGLGPILGIRSSAPLPDETYEPFPYVLDQKFQDCVANAGAMAILHAAWDGIGRPAEWPELASRAWLYDLARLQAGQSLDEDDGTFIHALFEGIATLGYPPESRWQYGPEHLSEKPAWDVAKEAADQKLVSGARRIVSTGEDKILDVATALASGSVVVLGTQLDHAFMDLASDDVWPGPVGPVIGGHAMVASGYRRSRTTGRLQFALLSSWGDGFADKGRAWVDEAAVASSRTSDLWIVQKAPAFSGATS